MYAAFPMYAQLFELNTSHWGLSSSRFAFNLPTVKFTKFIPSKLLIWVPLVLLQLPGAQKKEEELKADASLFFQTSVLLLQEPVAGPRRFDVCRSLLASTLCNPWTTTAQLAALLDDAPDFRFQAWHVSRRHTTVPPSKGAIGGERSWIAGPGLP